MSRGQVSGAQAAFQDLLPNNTCFGCGPDNEQGLRIKSFWSTEKPTETVCEFQGKPHHNAGSAGVLNGGIIATIMDCHSVMTAVAQAYRDAGREVGNGPRLWYVTGQFDLIYLAPARLDLPAELTARVVATNGKKSEVSCELRSGETLCTTSRMIAVHVPAEWHDV